MSESKPLERCVCGHQRYAHSPFHEGRCIAGEPLEGEYECDCPGFKPDAAAPIGEEP